MALQHLQRGHGPVLLKYEPGVCVVGERISSCHRAAQRPLLP